MVGNAPFSRLAVLKRIPSNLIRPGLRLPGALRDEAGRVLIPAGTELSEPGINKLGARVVTGLYGGDDWPDEAREPAEHSVGGQGSHAASTANLEDRAVESPDKPAQIEPGDVNVDVLRLGMYLSHDIYDQSGVLLLAAGRQVTSRFLLLLRQRRIKTVRLQPPADSHNADVTEGLARRQIDELLSADLKKQLPLGAAAGPSKQARLPLEKLWLESRRGLEQHVAASSVLANLCETVQQGGTASGDQARGFIGDFIDMLTLDCDLLSTIMSMQKALGEYLFHHCVNVALMSMTTAAQLGVSREQLLTIGLGAMFQDVGMLQVPSEIRLAPRRLTPVELTEVRRHPIYTLEFLERVGGLPIEARFIGYQVHERIDGSGYPRHRFGTTTHPFAKIVAVADAYCAMVRPRPHRPAKRPHDAVKELLAEGRRGRLDRTVLRAFLDCVSVFPVGSDVELDNGVVGRVVRANPGMHTRPVVAELGADGKPTDQIIDLSREVEFKVVRGLGLVEGLARSIASGSTIR